MNGMPNVDEVLKELGDMPGSCAGIIPPATPHDYKAEEEEREKARKEKYAIEQKKEVVCVFAAASLAAGINPIEAVEQAEATMGILMLKGYYE